METINSTNDIKNIVSKYAKYQKVMLIFDETTSNLEILNIYNIIKTDCIYNQAEFNNLNKEEIYNGYKLIIYCLSAENFLKLDFNQTEFVNVYISKSGAILPFYVAARNGDKKNYYLLQQNKVDICAISSLYLSQFFTYFNNLISYSIYDYNFQFLDKEITVSTLTNVIKDITDDMMFADLNFLKTSDVDYGQLPLIDLIIINAVITLLVAVKNRSLMLVDIYKVAKDNETLIDKYYAKTNNSSFMDIINLNYNYLYNLCLKTKEHILNFISIEHLNLDAVDELVCKLKIYCKNCDNILNYLYLFDIFGT